MTLAQSILKFWVARPQNFWYAPVQSLFIATAGSGRRVGFFENIPDYVKGFQSATDSKPPPEMVSTFIILHTKKKNDNHNFSFMLLV